MEIKDSSWIRFNFGIGHVREYTDYNRYARASDSWLNYQDTTLGGNFAINAPYQFTRYADIKELRLAPNVGRGMGRWYSNNINKWGHNIHIRCGVPAYSGILSYAIAATDSATARMVATGRTPGIFNTLGAVSGWIISAAFWEITLVATLINKFIEFTSSRYYYLKPTMFQYWSSVQTMVNTISANLGLSLQPPAVHDNDNNFQIDDEGRVKATGVDERLLETAHMAMPDVFRFSNEKNIGFDIHSMASRAQALQVQQQEYMNNKIDQINYNGNAAQIAAEMENLLRQGPAYAGNHSNMLNPPMTNKTMDAYKRAWSNAPGYGQEVNEKQVGRQLSEDNSKAPQGVVNSVKSWFNETVDSWNTFTTNNPTVANLITSEFRDGAAWFSLRVSGTDTVSESFSNSMTESEIGNIYNAMAEKMRALRFNLAGGQTGIAPVDAVVEGVGNMVGDFVTGAQSNTEMLKFMNPIISAFYGAQIDAPKRWNSSSASLPSMNFKLELRAGYGNMVSYFQDIIIPLCMILVAGLPRGTGPQSYGSPFYVEYYSKGRSQSRIGLITSISVERGVGNKGWTRRGFPLGVDVSVTIQDVTDHLFAPSVANMSIFGKWINPMEENAFGDYMACLSALGMQEQIYFKPQLKRRINKFMAELNTWTSPARWAAAAYETFPGQIISAFADQTARR